MAQTEHPTPGTLRKLSGLRELPLEQLQALSSSLEVLNAPKGRRLLEHGSQDPAMLYLLHGTIEVKAADGAKKRISHEDPSALSPIARLRPSRYEVTTASPVSYLRIDADVLGEFDSSLENSSTLMVDTYQVDEDTEISELNAENQLTVRIYEDLNANRLLLPSLPDIAIRVGEAVNQDYGDAQKVARLIENDPAIAAKILKVANSARFAGSRQVATLSEAVVRIGLQDVHQLVITFALRELFRSSSSVLNRQMQKLWEHSRQVAAIAHVLASHCAHLNRETGLLAGLLHDIGSIAVLGYARDFPEVAENQPALEASMQHLKAQLGSMILGKWQLPEQLADVAANAEHWQRCHDGRCDYADLVIIANLHALDGTLRGSSLPSIEQIPAYAKLGFAQETGVSSVDILDQARDEMRETLALLAA